MPPGRWSRLLGQRQGGGKQKAGNHRTQRSQKGADEVERDDGAHIALGPFLVLCQGVQDQEKDKQGGKGLQRAYEQGAQEAEEGGAGQEEAQDSAQDQADQNTFDQAELVPFAKQFHEEVPFWPKAEGMNVPPEGRGHLSVRTKRSKKDTLRSVSFFLERVTGLEPATSTLARWRSTR